MVASRKKPAKKPAAPAKKEPVISRKKPVLSAPEVDAPTVPAEFVPRRRFRV